MKNFEREEHVAAAQDLYQQVVEAGFKYGCLEIALTALGAKFGLKDVNRESRVPTLVVDKIEKSGLKINWLVNTDTEIDAKDIKSLFSGDLSFEESYPDGELTGYLWFETSPDQPGHVLVIFPEESQLYPVVDTEVGGFMLLDAENLAFMANSAIAYGGSFQIAQIKKIQPSAPYPEI